MKPNHTTLKDKDSIGSNEFREAIPYKKEEPAKPKQPMPKLPKRKWRMDRMQSFYLFHGIALIALLVAGGATQTMPLLLAVVPYGALLFLMQRIGGSLEGRGLDYVLYNQSVLVSAYLNSEMPNLRRFGKGLRVGGLTLLGVTSLFLPWGMAIGGAILAFGFLVAFADQETEEIAFMSRIGAIALLVTGLIGLFYMPGTALVTLTLSLGLHHLFEKWDSYDLELDE